MKFGFKFSNLLGTVYNKGNVVYTPDGNSVVSPVGNRVTVFDLVNHTSVTFPLQTVKDITYLAISPNGYTLIIADDSNTIYVVNFARQVILGTQKFIEPVSSIKYSENGAMVAVAVGKRVYVYRTPSQYKTSNSPFVLLSRFYQDSVVQSLDWSADSTQLLVCCQNGHVTLRKGSDKKPVHFSIHQAQPVLCVFGDKEANTVIGVSKKGIAIWANTEGKWKFDRLIKLDEFNYKVVLKTAVYHLQSQLLAIGGSNGQFTLYRMPEFTELYRLNISSHSITTAAINNSGEWLAFGCKDLGQLLVWEWRSETYILKQQGHSYSMNYLCYSSDGQSIATGGDDGKVKVWSTTSGYCYITFSDHTAPVTCLKFSPVTQQNVLFSASLDGTVRAYDLFRYRNFRTFVSPNNSQFSCLAVDPSGEIVVAGTKDSFEIYVWSVRTGQLTDILSGHESAISELCFDPVNPYLVSVSWDHTAKVWNIFEDKDVRETIQHTKDILTCAFSPDGKKFVSSTIDGILHIYETTYWNTIGFIDGKNDMLGVRIAGEERLTITDPVGKAFTRIAFTPDSECIIAGGHSNFVCIYNIEHQILIKKYKTTENRSLDGVVFDWKHMNEYGLHAEHMAEDFKEDENRNHEDLPGVKSGDFSKRTTKRRPITNCLSFSPTGRSWAAASTEGLLIYSLDDHLYFDPTDLTVDITPDAIKQALQKKAYLKALVMSIKLNEKELLEHVFERVPFSRVSSVCREFPAFFIKNFLQFLSNYYENHLHLEFQLNWLKFLFIYHGKFIKDHAQSMIGYIRNLQKQVTLNYNELSGVCNDNLYTIQYFKSINDMHSFIVPEKLEQVITNKKDRVSKWKSLDDQKQEESDRMVVDEVKETNGKDAQDIEDDKYSGGEEDEQEKVVKKVKLNQAQEKQQSKKQEKEKISSAPTPATNGKKRKPKSSKANK